MKFHSTSTLKRVCAFLVAGSTLLLASSTAVSACEHTCRIGVSKAFSDRYAQVTAPAWSSLKANLTSAVLAGVNLRSYVSDVNKANSIRTSIIKAVSNGVKILETNFDSGLETLVEDSIFNQSPAFRGDCNHPHRVTQPPPGVPWTMDDCRKMDRICGNPPSICHFFDLIKTRNIKTINNALDISVKNDFLRSLSAQVKKVLKSSPLKPDQIAKILPIVNKNLSAYLSLFSQEFSSTFCVNGSCDKFDLEIKKKLLKYP